jgi:superfamily II DNA/RNA helicase
LIVFSETIPDSVRKLTKKYLSADLVTINLAKKTAQEASAADDEEEEEVKIQ